MKNKKKGIITRDAINVIKFVIIPNNDVTIFSTWACALSIKLSIASWICSGMTIWSSWKSAINSWATFTIFGIFVTKLLNCFCTIDDMLTLYKTFSMIIIIYIHKLS